MAVMKSEFNKSEFIRARPNLSAAQISEEAEKLGQEISQGTIWSVRSADKAKARLKASGDGQGTPEVKDKPKVAKKVAKKAKVVAAKAAQPKVSKKAAKKNSKAVAKKVAKKAGSKSAAVANEPKFNRSAFIRSKPKMTAKEIIEAADALGQSITEGLIYNIRSMDRKKAEAGKPVKPQGAKMSASKVSKKVSKKVAKKPASFRPSTPKSNKIIAVMFDPTDEAARSAAKTFQELAGA